MRHACAGIGATSTAASRVMDSAHSRGSSEARALCTNTPAACCSACGSGPPVHRMQRRSLPAPARAWCCHLCSGAVARPVRKALHRLPSGHWSVCVLRALSLACRGAACACAPSARTTSRRCSRRDLSRSLFASVIWGSRADTMPRRDVRPHAPGARLAQRPAPGLGARSRRRLPVCVPAQQL